MWLSWGNNHNYLGMDLNLSGLGEVRVTMVDYFKKLITDLPKDTMKKSPTPTGDHMIKV